MLRKRLTGRREFLPLVVEKRRELNLSIIIALRILCIAGIRDVSFNGPSLSATPCLEDTNSFGAESMIGNFEIFVAPL